MRIGIDISQLVYFGSGVSVYTEQLVRSLLSIESSNTYCLFGSTLRRRDVLESFSKSLQSNGTRYNTRFYSVPQSMLTILWNTMHQIPIEILCGKIDVFHTSDWLEPPARAMKVTTIHDLLVYKYPQFMHPNIVDNQKRKLAWVKKESERIIVDSENTKEDVMEFLKVKDDRIRVIPLGVDPKFAPQAKERIEKTRLKYKIEGEYILTMGSSEPRKNISRVIEAYKKLSDSKNLKLVIVGKHDNNQIDHNKDITFLQDVYADDLPSLYAGARCFVYPSLYEGFGFPVLEALSSATIVVTSDRGSLKEVAGNTSIIVDPETTDSILDGMEQALKLSTTTHEERIQIGINWAKQYTWEKTAEKTVAVYNELI